MEAAELFEKGVAKSGGLSDPRMGTMDKFGGICTTDGANMHDCPGYFGHIELAQPVYHCKLAPGVLLGMRLLVSPHTHTYCTSAGYLSWWHLPGLSRIIKAWQQAAQAYMVLGPLPGLHACSMQKGLCMQLLLS